MMAEAGFNFAARARAASHYCMELFSKCHRRHEITMTRIEKKRDVQFDAQLFMNFSLGTVHDNLMCGYQGLLRGVNYIRNVPDAPL